MSLPTYDFRRGDEMKVEPNLVPEKRGRYCLARDAATAVVTAHINGFEEGVSAAKARIVDALETRLDSLQREIDGLRATLDEVRGWDPANGRFA